MSVAFETSSSHLTSQTHSKRSDRRSVGFAGHEDDLDDQEPVKQINLADIGIRVQCQIIKFCESSSQFVAKIINFLE